MDIGEVRYYALRIPYSIVQEIHKTEFLALVQPGGAAEVNSTVDAVGFDFIRTPEVAYEVGIDRTSKEPVAFIAVKKFRSEAAVQSPARPGDMKTLSMIMIDPAFGGSADVVDVQHVEFGDGVRKSEGIFKFPLPKAGNNVMAIFVDIYGNEAREVIPASRFGVSETTAVKASKSKSKKTAAKEG